MIISISDGVFNSLNKWLNKKNINKNTIIYNGIDIDKLKNAKEYNKKELSQNFDDNNIVILMTARFSPQKDQNTIIRSLTKLPKKYVAIFAGDGELMEKSKDLVQELRLEERVEFLGFRKDIPEITKTADIIVVSSIVEGFGLVAVEGMAAGKPIIVTDIEGLKDVISNPNALFKVGNEDSLISRIDYINSEKNKIKNSNYKTIKKYSITNTCRNYIYIYNHLVNKK